MSLLNYACGRYCQVIQLRKEFFNFYRHYGITQFRNYRNHFIFYLTANLSLLADILYPISLRLDNFCVEGRPVGPRQRELAGRADPRPGCGHPQGHHQRQQRGARGNGGESFVLFSIFPFSLYVCIKHIHIFDEPFERLI